MTERVVGWLDRLAARRQVETGRAKHLKTGLDGEEAALFDLRCRGFVVVAHRWNDCPIPGDLDLIGWEGEVLCFVEVKTRTSREVATASLAVDQHKRRMLRRMARHYLRHLPGAREGLEPQTRFDILTVYDLPGKPREITQIPGAFGWSERGRR